MQSNPILVENIRGTTLESFHRGAAVVVDYKGKVSAAWGNINQPVFTRSSIKYLQAIPLIETGAAEAFNLTNKEIALACSSHSGESEHTEGVGQWLKTLNLAETSLLCGGSRPAHDATYKELIKAERPCSSLHNPCSGKHLGFLATGLHQGLDIENYTAFNHPLQRQVRGIIEELLQVEGNFMSHAIDGCGIPVFSYPLKNIALGMTRLSPLSTALSKTRKNALARIREAITEYPFLIAGSHKFDTVVLEATKGKALVKVGAGGVYGGCIPEKGLGFALKIDDGNPKAAEVAVGTLLSHYDVFTDANIARLAPYLEPVIRNASNVDIGRYRSHAGWLLLKN